MRALSSRLLILAAGCCAAVLAMPSEADARGRGGFAAAGFGGGGWRVRALPSGRLFVNRARPQRREGIGFGPGYGPDFGFARRQQYGRWERNGAGPGGGFGGGYGSGYGGGGPGGPHVRTGIRPSPVAPPAIYAVGGRGGAIVASSGDAGQPSGVVSAGPRIIRIGR